MWRDFPKAVKGAGCHGGDLNTRVERTGLLLAEQHTCPINTASIRPQRLPPHHSTLNIFSATD